MIHHFNRFCNFELPQLSLRKSQAACYGLPHHLSGRLIRLPCSWSGRISTAPGVRKRTLQLLYEIPGVRIVALPRLSLRRSLVLVQRSRCFTGK